MSPKTTPSAPSASPIRPAAWARWPACSDVTQSSLSHRGPLRCRCGIGRNTVADEAHGPVKRADPGAGRPVETIDLSTLTGSDESESIATVLVALVVNLL